MIHSSEPGDKRARQLLGRGNLDVTHMGTHIDALIHFELHGKIGARHA